MKKKRIVVTGMGVVSPLGNDVSTFYNQLLQGKSAVSPIENFACAEYTTRFAAEIKNFDPLPHLDKKLARRADPYIAYAMVAGKKALEHSTLDIEIVDKECCGVLIGSGMGGMATFSNNISALIEKGPKKVSPFFVPYSITNMGGALLAMDLGFMGPNYSISTACASANHCIIAAANHIRNGDADVMLCGGVEAALTPIGMAGFIACKALSQNNDFPTKASRPWDKNRDGFVMGEGAGVLTLESLEHALKRGAPILAEYCGGNISCDAYHMTTPREDGRGVSICITNAIKDANLSPKDINYINAHATSTPAGDMAEVRALQNIFTKTDHIKMNATKSMIGHSLGAAAALGAIVTIQAIQTGKLHPTINVEDPEEEIKIDIVANTAQDHKVTAGLVNALGFGGHNASIILAPFNG